MKNDRGKFVLIAVLVVVFAALFWLCGSRETVTEMYDYHHALQNETVTLALTEGGNLFMGGEGKLPGVDVIRLMDEGKIKKADAVNVVIDDRFTEVGYYIANGYKNLETLKVGDGVRVIHNGAVKNCSILKYLYLPKGLEKVGADFLYGCGEPYIVTDGARDDLPALPGVAEDHILADVHSYADLEQRRASIPLIAWAADALERDDPDAEAVGPGRQVASPAVALDPGTYTFKLTGSGLDVLGKADVSVSVDGAEFGDFAVAAEAGALACKLTLSQRAEAVAIRATNPTDAPVGVTGLNVYENSYSIPPAVMNWWN